jgi:hypothetical protein
MEGRDITVFPRSAFLPGLRVIPPARAPRPRVFMELAICCIWAEVPSSGLNMITKKQSIRVTMSE